MVHYPSLPELKKALSKNYSIPHHQLGEVPVPGFR